VCRPASYARPHLGPSCSTTGCGIPSAWPESIPGDRPTILIADGLFAFLTELVIVGIFRRITEHFGSGELAFNDYGRIGPVSRIAVKVFPQRMFKDVGSQWGCPGFKDAHHPQ